MSIYLKNSHKMAVNFVKMWWMSHHTYISGKPEPSGLEFVVYDSISSMPLAEWDGCNADNDIFLSSAYLAALEQAPPANMTFKYVIFRQKGMPAAIGYFQVIELTHRLHRPAVESPGTANNTVMDDLHHKLVRIGDHISHRILVCGNALLSGEHGYAFRGIDEKTALQAVAQAAFEIKKTAEHHISAILIKDFCDSGGRPADMLPRMGYHPFDAGPNMVVPIRENWTSFDEYLKQMKSKYRKRATSAMKKGAPVTRRPLEAEEIAEHRTDLYALYGEVADKSKFRLYFLSPDYFFELKKRLGDKFVCEAYFEGEKIIGFTTRIINGGVLEGYVHGLSREMNKTYELYQNFLLADIREAISLRSSRINTGRTSIDMKSSVGAVPEEMKCYLRFTGKLSNQLVRPLFHFLKPSNEYCRRPFDN